MHKAYLTYTDEVATTRIDKYREGEARKWANRQFHDGKNVWIGKYSIRDANWRWFQYTPGQKTNFRKQGIAQPDIGNQPTNIYQQPNTKQKPILKPI